MRGVSNVLDVTNGVAVIADNTWRAFQAVDAIDVEHRFDFEKSWSNGQLQSVNLRPGAHILEAAGTLPVLKGLLRIARDFIQYFEQIEAVVWPHSESVIGQNL